MKIKIEDLLNRKEALDKVLAKDLPFKLAYRLNKIATVFMAEMKDLEKTRVDIVKSLGVEQPDGSFNIVDPEKSKEYREKWKDFVQEEIDFNIQKIPLEVLENGEVELSAYDVANLDLFIADEEPQKHKKKEK